MEEEDDTPMEVDNGDDNKEDEEKTPGRIAYGAFAVPDTPVEFTLLRLQWVYTHTPDQCHSKGILQFAKYQTRVGTIVDSNSSDVE